MNRWYLKADCTINQFLAGSEYYEYVVLAYTRQNAETPLDNPVSFCSPSFANGTCQCRIQNVLNVFIYQALFFDKERHLF